MSCQCKKFKKVENAETVEKFLDEIETDGKRWTVLCQCPSCGQHWEIYYPNSEVQGGGGAHIKKIDTDYAKKNYTLK